MSGLRRAGFGVGATVAVLALGACGQRGPLYLPSDPAAQQRATLPQVIVPALPRDNADAQRGTTRSDTAVPPAGIGAPAGGGQP